MPKATDTPTTPTRRAIFRGIGLTSITAGLAARSALASPAVPPDADAELIALCNRQAAIGLKEAALCEAIEDDDELHRAIKLLNDEWWLLTNRLEEIGYPTTLDGAKAMARAAIANVPRRRDGGRVVGDGACYGLLLRVSEFLAGGEVA